MPFLFSQVDLSQCKNVTVFLAPSVVSNIMKMALMKLTNLTREKGNIKMIRQFFCLFFMDIYILIFKGSELCSCVICELYVRIPTFYCMQVVQSYLDV